MDDLRDDFMDDLRDDGDPEVEFNSGIASRLPRKAVASGALIRNREGRYLFVVPNYKPFLDIPGGLAENNESPLSACRREVQEELGLNLHISNLLLVDWMPKRGVWQDSAQFIFDGGVLDGNQISKIEAAENELDGFVFLDLWDAKERLRPSMARRVEMAHDAVLDGIPRYGEFGRPLG